MCCSNGSASPSKNDQTYYGKVSKENKLTRPKMKIHWQNVNIRWPRNKRANFCRRQRNADDNSVLFNGISQRHPKPIKNKRMSKRKREKKTVNSMKITTLAKPNILKKCMEICSNREWHRQT